MRCAVLCCSKPVGVHVRYSRCNRCGHQRLSRSLTDARDRSEHTKRLVGDVAETPEFSYVGGLAESAANVGIMDGRRLDKLDGRRMLDGRRLDILMTIAVVCVCTQSTVYIRVYGLLCMAIAVVFHGAASLL
jgi:hypothetical protein